jgi:hypothetical protein
VINYNKFIKYTPIIILIVLILISVVRPIHYSEILVIVLFFSYFAISLFGDIINKQKYTTGIFIIVADIISIIILVVICYLYFMNYDKTNVDVIWDRKISIQLCTQFMILMVPVKCILESPRFKM